MTTFWCSRCRFDHPGECATPPSPPAPVYDWSPSLVVSLPPDKFLSLQVERWNAGESFVYLAPDPARATRAFQAFWDALVAGPGPASNWATHSPLTFTHPRGNYAEFMVCVMHGRSTSHVSCMFVEAPEESYPDQEALAQARYIPAPKPNSFRQALVVRRLP